MQTLTGILPTNSANAARLSDNLISVGIARPPNSAAHHIVPHGSFSNRDAATRSFIQGIQDIFRREGIDFNEAANGVFLPVSGFPRPPAYLHNNVHTNVYFRNLFDRLRIIPAGKPNDIREVLRDISQELLDGTFPIR